MEKPKIILAEEPAKQIQWFTKNWDKEIGALGIGKLTKGNIIVEKLVFPNQTVNGAHVHFKPSDWEPITKELSMEELGKIIFYWHKHPSGMPGASSTDEEDTFDAFMAPEAERRVFGFLQTAPKTMNSSEYEFEARICLAKPVRMWTTDVDLVLEIPPEDDPMKAICEKIIEDRVTIGYASPSDNKGIVMYAKGGKQTKLVDGDDYTDRFDVEYENGVVSIMYSLVYKQWLEEILYDPDLQDLYKKIQYKTSKDKYHEIILIHPKKKCGQKLFEKFQEIEDEMMGAASYYNLEEEEDDEEVKPFQKVKDVITLEDATNQIKVATSKAKTKGNNFGEHMRNQFMYDSWYK